MDDPCGTALERERRAGVLLATHSLNLTERVITRAVLLADSARMRSCNDAESAAIRNDADASPEQ